MLSEAWTRDVNEYLTRRMRVQAMGRKLAKIEVLRLVPIHWKRVRPLAFNKTPTQAGLNQTIVIHFVASNEISNMNTVSPITVRSLENVCDWAPSPYEPSLRSLRIASLLLFTNINIEQVHIQPAKRAVRKGPGWLM